jgi:RimJ/RimL family protein N-acetyltransferase
VINLVKEIEVVEAISDDSINLRRLTKKDAKFFYKSLLNEKVTNYLSLGPLHSMDHAKKLIKSYIKYWDQYQQFNYIINSNFNKLGSISLWNLSWVHRRAEVGIWILPKYWNQGFGKKSIDLIKKIAYNHLFLNRLESHIAIENKRSIKMFKSCGFKEEGILREYLNLQGKFQDALILGHLKNS